MFNLYVFGFNIERNRILTEMHKIEPLKPAGFLQTCRKHCVVQIGFDTYPIIEREREISRRECDRYFSSFRLALEGKKQNHEQRERKPCKIGKQHNTKSCLTNVFIHSVSMKGILNRSDDYNHNYGLFIKIQNNLQKQQF